VKPGTESGTAALKGKQKIQLSALKKSGQLAAGFLINAAANVAMVVTVFIASNTPRSTNPQVKETNQMTDAIKQVADKAFARVMAQREEILEAFVAKYGAGPDQVEQVEQQMKDGSTCWFIRIKNQTP